MARNDTLSEKLALSIAGGSSVTAAAESAGCSRRHASRLLNTPGCRSRVGELRSEITGQAVGLLADGATQAARTLVALLDDDESATRLNAAKAILMLLPKIAEHGELRHRVDAIEQTKS